MTKLAYGAPEQPRLEPQAQRHAQRRRFRQSKELFKKHAAGLADLRRARDRTARTTTINELTQQLLESPIVFFSGHESRPRRPGRRLPQAVPRQRRLRLRRGLLQRARTSTPSFRKPGQDDLYPDSELRPLDPTHPIFTASGKFVSYAARLPAGGHPGRLQDAASSTAPPPSPATGRRTRLDTEKGKKAFELAANVIAYATGLEPPRQKGDAVEIAERRRSRRRSSATS